MKKNDIALIVLIVSVSLVVSFFITKALVGEPQNHPVSAEIVAPISSTLATPESSIFNTNAINPTVNIQIGNSANQQPFSGN